MARNKIIYDGEVLIDLTSDSITPSDLASGVTAHDKSGNVITGTNTKDSDTSDATIVVAEMLSGKTAYARGSKLSGSMPNNGSANYVITDLDGENIDIGFHDGGGKAVISDADKEKLIGGNNIRKGVTILGQTGTMEEDTEDPETGKTVIPTTEDQIISPSGNYTCFREITVKKIPYTESENAAGGITVTIG